MWNNIVFLLPSTGISSNKSFKIRPSNRQSFLMRPFTLTPPSHQRRQKVIVLNVEQVTFSEKGTKIFSQTHHPTIWDPWNFTTELIPQCSFSFKMMWYTFLNRKTSESLWFYWYCLRNEGFQIFEWDFVPFSEKVTFWTQIKQLFFMMVISYETA